MKVTSSQLQFPVMLFSLAQRLAESMHGSNRRIHAWEQPYCTKIGHIKANAGEVRAILAYGKVLFTTHSDFKIRVWDVSITEGFHPKKITTLPQRSPFFLFSRKNSHQHKDYITCLAYNHVEKLLYTGSWDRTVKSLEGLRKPMCRFILSSQRSC